MFMENNLELNPYGSTAARKHFKRKHGDDKYYGQK